MNSTSRSKHQDFLYNESETEDCELLIKNAVEKASIKLNRRGLNSEHPNYSSQIIKHIKRYKYDLPNCFEMDSSSCMDKFNEELEKTLPKKN